MTRTDTLLYALAGFSVWLSGAVSFRIGGRWLFEHGPVVLAAGALSIAVSVCLALRAAMGWRKADDRQAVEVATIMVLPGLFAETARMALFRWATGLHSETAAAFAAVLFFGTGVLMLYAVIVSRRA